VHKVLKGWFVKKAGKKGIMGGSSKKRWFVLRDMSLTYFEKSDEVSPVVV